jgi:hypothetical protein
MSDEQHDLLLMYGARRAIALQRQNHSLILPAIIALAIALLIGYKTISKPPKPTQTSDDFFNKTYTGESTNSRAPVVRDSRPPERRRDTPFPTTETVRPATVRVVPASTLENTLKASSSAFLAGKRDVNNDGKINCIDAAVMFYEFWPDKRTVRIVHNRSYSTGFNHLFNEVVVDGRWVTVEPQLADGSMKVWGDRYDPGLNVVVTDDYKRYVK